MRMTHGEHAMQGLQWPSWGELASKAIQYQDQLAEIANGIKR